MCRQYPSTLHWVLRLVHNHEPDRVISPDRARLVILGGYSNPTDDRRSEIVLEELWPALRFETVEGLGRRRLAMLPQRRKDCGAHKR
jgi:hypothetical protein